MAVAIASTFAVAAVPGNAAAQSWDAVGGFSASNPSGQWTYGSTSTLGGTFTLMTNFIPNCGGASVQCWTIGGFPDEQLVEHNSSGTTQGILPPDMLNVDPQGGYDVVRWTAPSDGTFSFDGEFKSLDASGTDVYVLGNSGASQLFSSVLVGTSGTGTKDATFSFSQFVAAGNTVDFVTHGTDNGASFRGTGLAATISAQNVTTAPEPSSLALLGSGLIGLVPLVRKRRK